AGRGGPGLPRLRAARGARDRAGGRLGAHGGGAPRPVRGRVQRGRVHAPGRGAHRLPRDRRAARHRPRRRGGRGGGDGGVRRATAGADRLRAQLRAHHVRGRDDSAGHRRGGEAVVNGFPWLTVLWALPAAGAFAVFAVPRGRPAAAKSLALAVSLGTFAVAVVLAAGFDSGGQRYQFVEDQGRQ